MKILVTGGLGFIGLNFIKFLLKKSHKIINLDKITYASNIESKYLKNFRNYNFFKVDISKKNKAFKICKKIKPDAIINFAAETHVDRSIINSRQFIKSNIMGTHELLEVCRYFLKKKKIKFIQISTDEVYGSLGNMGSFSEQDMYKPNSPYSATKAAADHLVRAYQKTYKIFSIVAHPSNNFGPNQYTEKLIPLTISRCIRKKYIPVYGKGNQVRDWLFVKDTANAIYKILLNGKKDENYNISTKNEYKNIDIVKKICDYFEKKYFRKEKFRYKSLIKFVKDRPGHDFRYSLKNNKIKKINWKFNRKFDKKLHETIEWYIDYYKRNKL